MTRTSSFLLGGSALLVLGLVLGYGLERTWSTETQIGPHVDKLARAYNIIQSEYVDPVAPDTLAAHTIRGLVRPLDAYSKYVGRDRMASLEETLSGSFEGIGISYDLIDGPRGRDTLIVMTVVPGGPSEEAGLRAGDRIVALNGEETIGWTHERIRKRFKGPEGSTLRVAVRRPGRAKRLTLTIERGVVPLQTLEAAYMMSDSTGYLRLRRFARTTSREVSKGLETLEAEGMKRLILDLRGNAGGLLEEAGAVADEFLVDGQQIVSARSHNGKYAQTKIATGEGAFQEGPLIVLVDEHSASASEIVAGALQDHERALIVGRSTFGKGSVQRQFRFSDQTGLRLTIAYFYTPSGRRLQRDSVASTGPVSSVETGRPPPHVASTTDSTAGLSGRKEGGGIQPDRSVKRETQPSYRSILEERGVVQSFARQWMDARADSLRAQWTNRPEAFAQHFALPSSVVPAFIQYARAQGVSLPFDAAVTSDLRGASGTPKGAAERADPVASFRSEVKASITSYIGRRLFGTSMWIRVRNTVDPIVTEALHSWDAAEEMAARYPME